MTNGLTGKPHEALLHGDEKKEWSRRLGETTTSSREGLEGIITKGFLTDEEEKFFEELQNPEEIKKIAKQIISELCKRICDGENPSRKLYDDVCLNIIGMEGGVYPGYTKAQLKKLPDWKKIVDSFEFDNPGPHDSVNEFRKKRKAYMDSKINPNLASPDDPIRGKKTENTEPKIRRVETQSYNIKNAIGNYINFPSFTSFTRSEDIETALPLLKQEDVCIACFKGGYKEVTKDTKVPYFDMRGNQKLIEGLGIKKDGKISIPEKIGCLYNSRDDVSHICVFGDEPGGRSRGGNLCSMMVTIKGSVSQKDAIDLIEHLKKHNGLKFDAWANYPVDVDNTNRTDIQKAIVEYFNNK